MKSRNSEGSRSGATKTEKKLIALVSERTMEQVDELANWHKVAPAVIGAYLIQLGGHMLSDREIAAMAGGECATFIWRVLSRKPKRQIHPLPVVPEPDALDAAESRGKWIGRPLEEWLGQLIELALPHAKNKEIARVLMGDPVNAAIHATASQLRVDYGDEPSLLAQLDQPIQSPFDSFERALATEGGAA